MKALVKYSKRERTDEIESSFDFSYCPQQSAHPSPELAVW